jgi:transcriptional regulator with XRE-family HTH domain
MPEFNLALYKLIGKRIKKTRTDLQLSQEELSQRTSITRTSISNIELGRHQAPLHILYEIAKAVNTQIHFFVPSDQEVIAYIDNTRNTELMTHIRKDLPKQVKKEFEQIFNSL